MKKNEKQRGWSLVDWVCVVLIIGAVAIIIGCAQVGYVISAAGGAYSEHRFNTLEERVRALEDGDI